MSWWRGGGSLHERMASRSFDILMPAVMQGQAEIGSMLEDISGSNSEWFAGATWAAPLPSDSTPVCLCASWGPLLPCGTLCLVSGGRMGAWIKGGAGQGCRAARGQGWQGRQWGGGWQLPNTPLSCQNSGSQSSICSSGWEAAKQERGWRHMGASSAKQCHGGAWLAGARPSVGSGRGRPGSDQPGLSNSHRCLHGFCKPQSVIPIRSLTGRAVNPRAHARRAPPRMPSEMQAGDVQHISSICSAAPGAAMVCWDLGGRKAP